MAGLGELERAIMDKLWDSERMLTANDLRDHVSLVGKGNGRAPAVTTVLTVLARLERKGFVGRLRDVRPHQYRALLSREEHTSDLMNELLTASGNRAGALARFVGTVSSLEAATLRRLLDKYDAERVEARRPHTAGNGDELIE